MRTIAFIDGLNLYHSLLPLKSKGATYKWLDLKTLCGSFLQSSEELEDIYYFTALPYWNQGKVDRLKQYIKALEITGVKVIYGNFKRVTRKCRSCKDSYQTFEEKETDVNIGLYLLDLAYQDAFDKFLLLTGDTDLIPAIKIISSRFLDKQSHVLMPIHGKGKSLKDSVDKVSKIKEEHLKRSLFPDVIDRNGIKISKPAGW